MSESKNIAMPGGFNLVPDNAADAWRLAQMLAKSDMVPKDYKNKPENVMVAAAMGAELGLPPVQALQNIAVINGRPSVWGDALIGLVRGHRDCEDIRETFDERTMTATCVVKRRGQSPVEATFSQDDAKLANLWGKSGPWTQYPKRMLKLRARAFALRDAFADVLKGVAVAEEMRDVTPDPRDVTPSREEDEPRGGSAALKARLAQQQPPEAEPEPQPEVDMEALLADIAWLPDREAWRSMREHIEKLALSDEQRAAAADAMRKRQADIKKLEAEAAAASQPPDEDRFTHYQKQLEVVQKADAIQEIIDAFQRDDSLSADQRDLLARVASEKMEDSIPY